MSLNENFQIKLASEADITSIVSIVKLSFIQYCNAIGIDTIEALMESEQDVRKDMLQKQVYVAYLDDKAVGSIRIQIEGEKAFVSRFAILPDYQRMGIGSQMLTFIESFLASRKIIAIELYSAVDNHPLKEFYLRKGFQIVSVDASRGYHRGLFRKELNYIDEGVK